MITVEGSWFVRAGEKIGYIDGEHIMDHSGNRVGYVDGEHVFDQGGHRVAYISGDYIYFEGSSNRIRIEDNDRDIVGGGYSNIQKAAVRVLLGE